MYIAMPPKYLGDIIDCTQSYIQRYIYIYLVRMKAGSYLQIGEGMG